MRCRRRRTWPGTRRWYWRRGSRRGSSRCLRPPRGPLSRRGASCWGAGGPGYDVRPGVADQGRSVGAQWLDLGIEAAGEGGYARELTDEEKAQQQKKLEEAITGFDVVMSTALVPGRPAPRLVTAAAVEGMKPGSVGGGLAGGTRGNR